MIWLGDKQSMQEILGFKTFDLNRLTTRTIICNDEDLNRCFTRVRTLLLIFVTQLVPKIRIDKSIWTQPKTFVPARKMIRVFGSTMAKKNYQEGTWFNVPLADKQFAVGLVARNAPRGAILLAYFLRRLYDSLPSLPELRDLRPEDAVMKMRVGDLGLIRGEWKVIGRSPDWDRSQWPMPQFVQVEPITNRIWLLTYADDDPNRLVSRKLINEREAAGYDADSVYGYKAAEKVLSKVLKKR